MNDDETDVPASKHVALVVEIEGLMASGRWVRGKSHRELCQKYQCHIVTVKRAAAEASRNITSIVESTEELRARVAMGLEFCTATLADVIQSCGPESKVTVAAAQAQVQAYTAMAKLCGADAPKRIEHSGTLTGAEAMSELVARAKKMLEEKR